MWNLMTLDGYFEGPNHDLSFHEDVWGKELEDFSIEQGRAAGALIFGRITYELMASYWPSATGEVADFMNTLPKIVFSRTIEKSEWGNTRFIGDNAVEEVAKLKREVAKHIYVFGSANLSASLISAGLFDEFRLGVTPHLLGGGTPLFKTAATRQMLRFLEARPLSTGVVVMRYAPA
jgi:dihydrofolate reductase